ncbi:ribonuclease H-like domain-containing protein [Tanacetum coccineum]
MIAYDEHEVAPSGERGWEQLLDIDDFDLPLTPVLRPCNSHVRETTTTTKTQNPAVDNLEEKSFRITLSPAGIVQVAKLHKQSDIHEGGDESVLLTQEYIRKVVDDVGEDEDFRGGSWVSAIEFVNANGRRIVDGCLGDIENYLKNGKLEQVVTIIKSCTPNALGDLTVTLKDFSVFFPKPSMHYPNITMRNVVKVFHKDTVPESDSGVGGSGMLMEEEEIVKLMKEEEMVDLELQVYKNVTDQEDLYKFDEEALNPVLSGHGFLFHVAEGGGALGSSGALKPSTHPVIAIFLYLLGAVEAVCALEVDAMRALDLMEALKVEVDAVGALDLMEVEAVGALDVVGLSLNILILASVSEY